MFAGIVEESARIVGLEDTAQGMRLSLVSRLDHSQTKIGDSVAVDGVCLTVTHIEKNRLCFNLSPETMRRTTLGRLRPGAHVNLERSLSLGGRIHGHLVYGHVDGVISLLAREQDGKGIKMVWSLPHAWQRHVVRKGSVAVSGVSLTVGEVLPGAFSVYLIPHTLRLTTFADMQPGALGNLEVDMLARYVASMLGGGESQGGVTKEMLSRYGYLSTPESTP